MGGYKNLDFIVWMRPVSNSDFKKLHRTLENVGAFKDGLPKGVYRLEIENSMFLSLNPRIKYNAKEITTANIILFFHIFTTTFVPINVPF